MDMSIEQSSRTIPSIVSVSRGSADFDNFTDIIQSWGEYDIEYIKSIGVSTTSGVRRLTFFQTDGIHTCLATKNEQTTEHVISSVRESLATITVCLPYGGGVVSQSVA